MIDAAIIQELILYFAKFVPLSVRKEVFKQPPANSDMLTEALKMQRNLGIIKVILEDMKMQNDICPAIKYINFPTDLMPLDPSLFFNHAGWAATFSRKKTII